MVNSATAQDTGLNRYVQEANGFPMLSVEDEQAYATAWRERRDAAALRLLVGSHLRLVIKIARGFSGYGLPLSDLIAEGNVGLMQAAEKFEPAKGFRFATYAMWWVRAAVQEYILHNWSLVKIGTTAAQKKLFFNLRRIKGRMQALEQGDLPPDALATIARELDVSEAEVREMNRRLAAVDSSLNVTVGEEGESDWLEMLADDRPTQEAVVVEAGEMRLRRQLLDRAMRTLNPRERHILAERRLKDEPSTLEELSSQYAVSRERIRQIEVRAFEKLRRSVLVAAQSLRTRQPIHA
ncbi:RNA polymerase sigma factor RpoH [Arenibaculum pallidiluteum]|uniref:RNA polymerase sigma factor RpoH n=1 Tax=Arenibaculum pallidiluteum TaxID=2812559 RepID=UPI001A97BE9A|nr:RNA polymerase sigma factor RpoH [Arenibaculum pallidiluteum]